ncbi:uncharacterized protein LOC123305952 isoform X2 [Chrysoperla carnea]|uniref:uncharacterized protein LOC123305952 isoform X2 n=1 Tax=Chrysoperla carnea TaxID=189513 RepID=UPI001D06D0DE|nr:uncharacterized protein LOC123305952 isoform X2 [Chrysoperla carnea]
MPHKQLAVCSIIISKIWLSNASTDVSNRRSRSARPFNNFNELRRVLMGMGSPNRAKVVNLNESRINGIQKHHSRHPSKTNNNLYKGKKQVMGKDMTIMMYPPNMQGFPGMGGSPGMSSVHPQLQENSNENIPVYVPPYLDEENSDEDDSDEDDSDEEDSFEISPIASYYPEEDSNEDDSDEIIPEYIPPYLDEEGSDEESSFEPSYDPHYEDSDEEVPFEVNPLAYYPSFLDEGDSDEEESFERNPLLSDYLDDGISLLNWPGISQTRPYPFDLWPSLNHGIGGASSSEAKERCQIKINIKNN